MNEEVNFCSQCGAKVSPGAKFCSNCGYVLQSSSTQTQLDKAIKTQTPLDKTIKVEVTNATVEKGFKAVEKGTKAIPAIIILVADIIKIVFGFIFRLLKPLVIVLAVIFFVMLLIELSSSFLA
jgi:uncharacterized membrane protein YvbJ